MDGLVQVKYIGYKGRKIFNVPVVQFGPVYPAVQLQSKPLLLLVQLPPFLHGLGVQSAMCAEIIYIDVVKSVKINFDYESLL